MIADRGAQRVVVGIDGSEQALAAAGWGAREAVHHDVAVTLLYVVNRNRAPTKDLFAAAERVAEAALREAEAAVSAMQQPVKIESGILCGDPGTVLFEASRSAALLCLGAPQWAPHGPSDSLALQMAATANCTVAVVPSTSCAAWAPSGRVIASVNTAYIDYDALQIAIEQADLHSFSLDIVTAAPASVSAEELLSRWRRHCPDVDVHFADSGDLLRYVAEQDGAARVVVVGAENPCEIEQLIELTRARPAYFANPAVVVVRSRHL